MRIYNGDCLKIMPLLPSKSVDLIVIDPPYNIKKASWDSWKRPQDYLDFMGKVFIECQRLLKDNGSFYWFHNDFLTMCKLQNWIEQNTRFIFKSLITIDKLDNSYVKDKYASQEHFRNYLNLSEYILYYTFQDETGLTTVMLDTNNFSSLRQYFKDLQEWLGMNIKQINAKLGNRNAEHTFYWKTTQWDLCTVETYQKLIDLLHIDKWQGFREYESLRQEYESLRYTFNKKDGLKNVWAYKFRTDKRTKHPTQKPIKLMEDIISYSSNEGDLVLDCFAGSFSTGVACQNLGRHFIGIELDKDYYKIGKERMAMNRKLW